jgi:hypothetical protein
VILLISSGLKFENNTYQKRLTGKSLCACIVMADNKKSSPDKSEELSIF